MKSTTELEEYERLLRRERQWLKAERLWRMRAKKPGFKIDKIHEATMLCKGPSDDYILNGHWHKCCCGAWWSDSDGGPCHQPCEKCDAPTDADDGLCDKCRQQICPECGEPFEGSICPCKKSELL